MKPQAGAFLIKAEDLLDRAEIMWREALHEDAGRTAYLAGFHAAQALIFQVHDRVFKSHASVQGEFGRLVRDSPRFEPDLRAFLGRTYGLKAIADHETGPGATIGADQSREAIDAAHRFVRHVAEELSPSASNR